MEPGLIPYLPSLRLYREWMARRLAGEDDAGAWNDVTAGIAKRERRYLARTVVAGAHGQDPIMLSVPVEGGGSMLKRGDLRLWRISMHGRWQDMHLGALSAAYGATPFYPHIEPALRSAIKGAREGMPFLEMSVRLHEALTNLIDIEALLPELRRRRASDPEAFRHLASEKSAGMDTELAFLDVICRRGPESIFVLL